jgi:hypothetical protein
MKKIAIGFSIVLMAVFSSSVFANKPLTFEERVKAQEAIERVYYNHRIWPKENPQPKPPFEKMALKEVIEAKVTDYLKKCSALDKFWQRPIIASQLQAEMDRMAKGTKDPATLNELFKALNDDPYLIAECLARPVLADRLIHNWYANDERFHADTKAKAEKALKTLTPENFCGYTDGKYSKMIYKLEVDRREEMEEMAPEGYAIKLDQKEFARMLSESPDEGKISGVIEKDDCFLIVHTIFKSEQETEIESLSFQKQNIDEWLKEQNLQAELPKAESDPANNYFTPMPESACTEGWTGMVDAPNRGGEPAVWTGSEMIAGSRARYNLSTDSWTPTSSVNRPSFGQGCSAIWTGTELIIWGAAGPSCGSPDIGGRYNPVSDSWQATSTGANCPLSRQGHSAIWTGTEMVVWGGICIIDCIWCNNHNDGGRYNPETNTWSLLSTGTNCPAGRGYHSSTWTGSEMIVWGGYSRTEYYDPDQGCYFSKNYMSTGGRYCPSTDSWLTTSSAGIPDPNPSPSAVWTGTEMLLWGMTNGACRRYNPSGDTWGTASATNKPSEGKIIWTGKEMVVWSGSGSSGGKYNPSADTWNSLLEGSNPLPYRYSYADVWTGNAMIIWGGTNGSVYFRSGGIYYIPYSPSSFSNNLAGDNTGCSDSGVLIEWSAPSNWGDSAIGTRTFDVLRDGSPIATGLSGSTLSYTDTTGDNGVSYLYQVRANNGCGLSATTAGMSAADNVGTAPNEVASFNDVCGWDEVSKAEGYRVYRGGLADLPNLMNSSADGCLRYEGTEAKFDCSSDDPSSAAGSLYWYLVTAYAGGCEGTAGEGTGFTRNLSSTGSCP